MKIHVHERILKSRKSQLVLSASLSCSTCPSSKLLFFYIFNMDDLDSP